MILTKRYYISVPPVRGKKYTDMEVFSILLEDTRHQRDKGASKPTTRAGMKDISLERYIDRPIIDWQYDHF